MTQTPVVRHRLTAGESMLAVAAILLMGAGGAWAGRGTRSPAEQRVFERMNGLPDGLRYPLWPVMQMGNALVWIVGPPAVWLATGKNRPALAPFVGPCGAYFGAKVVKRFVRRGRPEVFLEAVRFREEAPTGVGFVSGHAAVALAFVTALRPYLPRPAQWLLLGLAPVVGVGRVFFGAHLPADIVGGAGFGIACGLAANAMVGVESSS